MAIDKKIREEIEMFVCEFFDALDKTGANTEYWKEKFAHMSDYQFKNGFKRNIH